MARLIEHDESPASVDPSASGSASAGSASSGSASSGSAVSVAPTDAARGWPLLLSGPLAALGAFLLTAIIFALPVFALWLTMPQVGPEWDTWQEVARICGLAWMAGWGFPVTVSGLLVTLLPWGLLAITVGLLLLSGRWAARTAAVTTLSDTLIVTLSGVVVYAGLALSVTTWIGEPGTGPGRVLLSSFAVGIAAFGTGVAQGAGQLSVLRAAVPAAVRRILSAAAVAVAVLIAAAAIAVGASVMAHAEQSHRLLIALAPDAAGFVALVLLSLGYLPILVIWGMSYLMGTGFVVSAGVVVSPFSTPGEAPLPVFPLLGALPQSAPPGAQALPVVGLIAGMLAAGVLKRRGGRGWPLLAESAAMVAIASGLLWGLLAAASGSLGEDQLAGIGPIIGPTVGVAAALWGVGSLIIMIPALASPGSGSRYPDEGLRGSGNKDRQYPASGVDEPGKGIDHGQ